MATDFIKRDEALGKNASAGVEKPSYVALFRRSGQITETEWDAWTETKICTRETTIGEIEDWYKQRCMRDASLSIELVKAST